MLNITKRDRLILSTFFCKNPDIAIMIKRFKNAEDKANFESELDMSDDSLYCACIFIRREYNGYETYAYVFEDTHSDKIYSPNVKSNKGKEVNNA